MTSRRKFLSILGGGIILAAGAGTLWAATRDPAQAREPWQIDTTETDPRRRALSYAILAPNPHNRQPWLVDLAKEDLVTLHCQDDRRLVHTDPFDRQITIGLGCFIELFVQAAAQDGYRVELNLFPGGEPQPRLDTRPVAQMRLVPDTTVAPDPLFAMVLDRRSNKAPYDPTRIPADGDLMTVAGAAKRSAVAFTTNQTRVATLRETAWQAMYVELTTLGPAKESLELTRFGRAEIEANPDGISLAGPLIEGLSALGMLSRDALLDPSSSAFQQQVPVIKSAFDTAMGFVWQTTPGNSRTDQIAAGRDYVRLNLAATGLGIAMSPFSQALQEYPELTQNFATMRSDLGIAATDTLQMLVRVGYAPVVPGAPRWPASSRIIQA